MTVMGQKAKYSLRADVFSFSRRKASHLSIARFKLHVAIQPYGEDYLAQWKDIIGMMLPDFHRDDLGRQVTDPYLFASIVGAYENVPLSISLTDVAALLFDISSSEIITDFSLQQAVTGDPSRRA